MSKTELWIRIRLNYVNLERNYFLVFMFILTASDNIKTTRRWSI